MLAKEIILDGKYLSPWSFKNIASTGIRNGAYQWTEEFIQHYKNRLAPQFKKNGSTLISCEEYKKVHHVLFERTNTFLKFQ